MKTTFGQAKEIVERMALAHRDETLPVADMRFNDLKSMEIAGQEFEVLPSAQRLFASRFRVPHSYLVRCSAELQADNLNFWIEQEQKTRDTLFCRFDGMKLRAVFTDRYKVLDNREIVEKMDESGYHHETEVHLTLDRNLMVIKVPDYARSFFINAEKMTPGIAISNSEVGVLAFSIEAYFYRLVCTNGLISKTEVASKFRHVSERALQEFHEIVRQVTYESQRSQNRFSLSREQSVENPLATIDSFNRQFQLTKKEKETVTRAWEEEPGNTMFAVINAYTRAGQDHELSAEESNRLERIGGQILSLIK